MDTFHPGRKPYLAIVDFTTNFFSITQLPDKLSYTIVILAKHHFSEYGIPKVVISDNGLEFTVNTFNFLKQWDFKHVTSNPHYPKSNGQIERAIQTIKKSIKKHMKDNADPYLALLAIHTSTGPENNTPAATYSNTPQTYNKNPTTLNE